MELPEFVQLANQKEVRAYVIELLTNVQARQADVMELLSASMIDWRMQRLARIDQDILRIAVTEMTVLGVPEQVAINEAVELAKRYSGEDGHRFINGVLRRVSDRRRGKVSEPAPEPPAQSSTNPNPTSDPAAAVDRSIDPTIQPEVSR